MAIAESEFRTHCDAALDKLYKALGVAAEEHDVEVLFQNGVLTLEVEEPNAGKIVISPQIVTRQVWISARSRSFKLDWSGESFVLASTGETLQTLVGRLIGEQLGIEPLHLGL